MREDPQRGSLFINSTLGLLIFEVHYIKIYRRVTLFNLHFRQIIRTKKLISHNLFHIRIKKGNCKA